LQTGQPRPAAGQRQRKLGDWPHFVAHTAKVNSFSPGIVAPPLAAVATAAEALLGVALLLGVLPRLVTWASAMLPLASCEIFLKISLNLSPAGVTSPFVARPMPTNCAKRESMQASTTHLTRMAQS
jgi:hypothetical protein